jgi:formylglycine-generating enzyme required for sulfatase activity
MPPQLEDWNMLYSEYIGWVDDLHKDNTLKKQWGDDQDLKKILVKIRDASYPDSVALENSKTVNDLKDIKTEEELQLLGVTEKAVSDALKAVNDIKSFFDPNSDKAWPLLRRINKDAKDFNERGWQRPAAYLQNLVDSVRPTPDNNTLAANVDKLIKLRRRGITEKIRVCLDDIAKYQKKITGFNDGFVNKEAALGLGDAGEESLSKLSKNLQEINKLAGELAGYIDEMDGLVRKIESYIKEGRISNPAEAAACEVNLSELMPVIKEIRSIKGIAKNEQDIRQGIDQLDKLRERAFRAIEKPEEYVKRIKQTLSAAKSEKIAEKWEIVKKNLLPKIEQNPKDMSLYSEFRQKIDKANDDLIALDEELQEKLPQELIAELGEKIWQQRLRQIYEQERKDTINRIVEKIPMTNAVPDINEATFKNQRDEQYSEFGKWRDNLAGIVGDFNAIADGLELCYLLDDILPQRQESISSIWKNWKDRDVPKKREIEDGLNELISRVEMLVEVKLSGDRQKLVATALDPKSQPEAVYAAWEKLGVLSNPKWPNQAEDWENDKKIQETLKLQFNTIKGQNQSRGDELLNMLDTARDKREKVYREVSIERYRADIKKYSYQDQTLLQFEKFQPYGPDPNLSEINDFEALASKLAEFVTSEDWQSKKFDTNLFYMFCKPETITFEDWPKKIKEYRIIEPDPREQYAWKKTMEDIKNELPTAEDSNKLRADFEKVKPDIYKMLDLSAIEKNRGEFEKSEGYWKQLLAIQEQLKPSYCNYLNLANGKVTFASEVNLQAFEPVLKNDNDSFSPPPVTKWNDIKNIKDKFFYPTSDSDANWPRYIRSSKDQSVILAFIPAGRDNPEPFYMATKEITNAQYCLFLKNIDAKDSGKLGGGVEFVGQDHKPLISWASDEEPHGAIKYDKLKKGSYVDEPNNNAPVTWVTFSGADSYAVWLSGKLPLASQHRYACRANADTKNPWWNDRAQIPLYAHVRAAAWQRIAKEYNSTIGSLEVGLCPIGAVKEKTPLDINNIVEDGYNSPWPIATKTKANEWGLCDMIGNVWEWCRSDEKSTQTVICGGSCLAPKDYVAPDSKYDFKGGRACDVGFRVIVPAKQSP